MATLVLAAAALAASAGEDENPGEIARGLVIRAFAELRRGDSLPDEDAAKAYTQGLELARRATRLDPGNADAWYALFCHRGRLIESSNVASQMFQVSKLRSLLDKVLEIDPSHAHAWQARGEMLLRLPWLFGGSESEGEEALLRAAELEPGWAKPWIRLAELENERGNEEQAALLARRARELAASSDDEELRTRADRLLERLGSR